MKKKVIVSIPLIGMLAIFFIGNSLKIKSVSYSGQTIIKKDVLEKKLTYYEGNPLVQTLFQKKIRKELMSNFPILDIKIQYRFPRDLHVNINEEDPWIFYMGDEKQYLISREGKIIEESKLDNIIYPETLIIVRGMGQLALVNGRLKKQVFSTIKKIDELKNIFLKDTTFMIDYNKNHHLELILNDTFSVWIGKIDRIETKMKMLKIFLKEFNSNKKNINYIDLTVPGKLFVAYD